MSKAKFEYCNFTIEGSWPPVLFVAHAKKFTPEQTLEKFFEENWELFDDEEPYLIKRPEISDVVGGHYVKYYPILPDCWEKEPGYTFCNEWDRGRFPVWVIDIQKLRDEGSTCG